MDEDGDDKDGDDDDKDGDGYEERTYIDSFEEQTLEDEFGNVNGLPLVVSEDLLANDMPIQTPKARHSTDTFFMLPPVDDDLIMNDETGHLKRIQENIDDQLTKFKKVSKDIF